MATILGGTGVEDSGGTCVVQAWLLLLERCLGLGNPKRSGQDTKNGMIIIFTAIQGYYMAGTGLYSI